MEIQRYYDQDKRINNIWVAETVEDAENLGRLSELIDILYNKFEVGRKDIEIRTKWTKKYGTRSKSQIQYTRKFAEQYDLPIPK